MGLHFDFSSEQRMLGDSVRRLFARESKAGVDAGALLTTGRRLAEQGLFGVMTPENAGGLGLGLTDALAIALEAGRAQTRFPVIETIVAARLLSECRPEAVAAVLDGKEIATCASSGDAVLVAGGQEGRIRGAVTVPFAAEARWLALPMRPGDSNEPRSSATLIDLRVPGVAITTAPEMDLTYPVYRVSLDIAVDTAGLADFDLEDQLAVLACGEMTGAAAHCHDMTLRHLRERVQFGKPIGINQSLRHRAAEDWMAVEGMQAASEYAAACFDSLHTETAGTPVVYADWLRAAHVAKAYCSQAARCVAEHAIQSHGGIGFTWEYGLHIPVRRILRLAAAHGDATDRLDALANSLLSGNRRPE